MSSIPEIAFLVGAAISSIVSVVAASLALKYRSNRMKRKDFGTDKDTIDKEKLKELPSVKDDKRFQEVGR
jgi:orotate phosphoribosyltransferase